MGAAFSRDFIAENRRNYSFLDVEAFCLWLSVDGRDSWDLIAETEEDAVLTKVLEAEKKDLWLFREEDNGDEDGCGFAGEVIQLFRVCKAHAKNYISAAMKSAGYLATIEQKLLMPGESRWAEIADLAGDLRRLAIGEGRKTEEGSIALEELNIE